MSEIEKRIEALKKTDVDLSSLITFERTEWMASRLDPKDTQLVSIVRNIVAELPESPTVEEIGRQVHAEIIAQLSKLDPDLDTADEVIEKNRKPLTERFLNRDTPLLGEYFDPEHPANVCQQNVLLIAAVSAIYGFSVQVAPFIYTGSTTGLDRLHAVAVYQDLNGDSYILDPTLMVPKYGDVTYVRKEEYLARFINPRLMSPTTAFSPKNQK